MRELVSKDIMCNIYQYINYTNPLVPTYNNREI